MPLIEVKGDTLQGGKMLPVLLLMLALTLHGTWRFSRCGSLDCQQHRDFTGDAVALVDTDWCPKPGFWALVVRSCLAGCCSGVFFAALCLSSGE